MKAETQASAFLSTMVRTQRARLAARVGERAGWERRAAAAPPAPSFAAALGGPAVAVIAEVKRRSPSAGAIRSGADAALLARSYAAAGAAAISVLTEPEHFGGSLDDLAGVAAAVSVPVLRKDFVVDPLQLCEARALGASAVLLIVRALDDAELETLAADARALGLDTLVEVHDRPELERALALRPTAIGVNARDLESLEMDPTRHASLLPLIPAGFPAVAESGLATRADVERVASAGADAVLAGTALAGAADPAAAVRALVGVARVARTRTA
jgi:indole-3-glycerol phosphate synthase